MIPPVYGNETVKETLNKSLRASAGSFSDCRCQIPLDVAMLRLRGLFLASRKNPSTDARIDLISVSLRNILWAKRMRTKELPHVCLFGVDMDSNLH